MKLRAEKTPLRLDLNASAFHSKRKYVLGKTQVRLKANALAFFMVDNTDGFSITFKAENKLENQDIAVDDEEFMAYILANL